ncbi:MAG: TIGR04211 family SH3 domain-containing protein [Deltaproteobacteria bacterium]|nr:TIGR04211 family SH3 domain-containing protein [Deltaproteobacteria bacterium]
MTKRLIVLGVAVCIGFSSGPGRAEKVYVTNPTRITLRNGPGINERILAMVPQDEPVEILESRQGWRRIRLLDPKWNNKEGWMASGFLAPGVPGEVLAKSLKAENVRLKQKLTRIEAERETLTDERDQLRAKVQANERSLMEMQNKYEALKQGAEGYLKLKEEYAGARERMQNAVAAAKRLAEENKVLRSSERNTWFMTGGAVMLAGLIFGFVLGKREKRRKSSYY